ncbi:MAG: transcription antitermination factor NusB, partial [Gemmatimonadota bacterium]
TPHARSRARAWALQLLYGWELAGRGSIREHAAAELELRRISPRYRPYAERLLELVDLHRRDIDRALEENIANWRLERLDTIDRNVLRIGIAELLYAEDVPPKVAIHEAVRLAGRYGSEESPRFVNGVLDAIYKRAAV